MRLAQRAELKSTLIPFVSQGYGGSKAILAIVEGKSGYEQRDTRTQREK